MPSLRHFIHPVCPLIIKKCGFCPIVFVLEHLCPASVVQRPSASASELMVDRYKENLTDSLTVQEIHSTGKLQLELTLESISCAFWLGLHSGSKAKKLPK
jgi:hypothetical protein